MSTALEASNRAILRQFMADRFNMAELTEICFDLSLDFEEFPRATKSEFVQSLIGYFERKGSLACLLLEILKRRQDEIIGRLLALVGGCDPRKKVQIVLSNDIVVKPEIKAALAQLLGVSLDEVAIMASAPGSTKLLVGLPAAAADRLLSLGVLTLVEGKYQIQSMQPFDALSPQVQADWRSRVVDQAFTGSSGSNTGGSPPASPPTGGAIGGGAAGGGLGWLGWVGVLLVVGLLGGGIFWVVQSRIGSPMVPTPTQVAQGVSTPTVTPLPVRPTNTLPPARPTNTPPRATPTATLVIRLTPTPTQRLALDNPFAYCAVVGTIDAPDNRYTGPAVPDSILRGFEIAAGFPTTERLTVWRCMDRQVYACSRGANLPCETKADISRTPSEAMTAYCRANPTTDFIPAAVTGRATVYTWRCVRGTPTIVDQYAKPDAAGFLSHIWYLIDPNARPRTPTPVRDTTPPAVKAVAQPDIVCGTTVLGNCQTVLQRKDVTDEAVFQASVSDASRVTQATLEYRYVFADQSVKPGPVEKVVMDQVQTGVFQVTLNVPRALAELLKQRQAELRGWNRDPHGVIEYRVLAVDEAGNVGESASQTLRVVIPLER